MAVAPHPDMTKEPPAAVPVAEYRLPQHHVQDLRDVARGLEESDVGIRTRYLDDANDGEGGDGGDVHLFELEAFCNRFGILGPWSGIWRSRVRRCRAALRRLSTAGDQRSVAILHVVYGYGDPSVRRWPRQAVDVLGDLAPLLRYTDATEEVRRRLVREAALRCAPMSRRPSNAAGLRPLAVVVSLSDARARERFFDRATDSGSAVADALAPLVDPLRPRGKDETKLAHEGRVRAHGERMSAHAARRREYLARGREEAAAMLTAASRAYNAAWLAASGD